MNDAMRKALDGVLAGDAALLKGFGVERRTTVGSVFPPDSYEWDERLSVQGDGAARLAVRRSIADVSGEEIGEYRDELAKDAVRAWVQQIRHTAWDAFTPMHIEPTDLKVRLTVVVGGQSMQVFVGVSDPAALDPLQDLLQALDRLAGQLRAKPHMTLGVVLDAAEKAPQGAPIPVTLRVCNSGGVGYWVHNPAHRGSSEPGEQCELLYCKQADVPPDVTPLPAMVAQCTLENEEPDPGELLWLDAGGEVTCKLFASPRFEGSGRHLLRAKFAAYSGEDTVGGQPRMRGCVFSNEVAVEVG